MKNVKALCLNPSLLALLISFLLLAQMDRANAYGDCETSRGRACYQEEKLKPDSSREGVSALDYCSATAILACQNSASRYNSPTPQLNDPAQCQDMAERSGNWDKDVYHDCMGNFDESFRW